MYFSSKVLYLVYANIKSDSTYYGYSNFQFIDGIPTITQNYKIGAEISIKAECKLELIRIPKELLNGQVLNGTPVNIIVDEREVNVLP